jgi:alkylation response protein AidB-like acyl-CoA dehydrogenase
MQLNFTPDQEAFRLEVRDFVKLHLPVDIRRKVELGLRLEQADYVTWFRILQARGWLTPGWPVQHGGPGCPSSTVQATFGGAASIESMT